MSSANEQERLNRSHGQKLRYAKARDSGQMDVIERIQNTQAAVIDTVAQHDRDIKMLKATVREIQRSRNGTT